MVFADEIRPTDPVKDLVGGAKAPKKEVDAAVELIEAMTTEWEPDKYEDRHRKRMREVIEAKGEGQKIEPIDDGEAPTEVPDLMAALEATLAKAKRRPTSRSRGRATARSARPRSSCSSGPRSSTSRGARR